MREDINSCKENKTIVEGMQTNLIHSEDFRVIYLSVKKGNTPQIIVNIFKFKFSKKCRTIKVRRSFEFSFTEKLIG